MQNETENLMGIEELAAYLGVRTSTIYGWAHVRAIPYFKIGRLLRFKKSEIDRWINERKVKERVI
jgi:PTS system nitrogen regulatory IIA component